MPNPRMSEIGSSGVGPVAGGVLLLSVLAWILAVLILPHVSTTNQEALNHNEAMYQIDGEMDRHLSGAETILVPRFDSSLDIFVNRRSFENVPYPDRSELAAAISDIWCNQISTFLLPAVQFRDVQSGSTLLTQNCIFQSSPDITGIYSGTVHNSTANVDSTFDVQLVKGASGIRGCMQVALPLVGTGPVNGTLSDRSFVIDLTSSDMQIRFGGTRVGHIIRGNYRVAPNGEIGTFSLHQDGPRVKMGFDPSKCPR